jgi:hypothetical protein
MPDEARIRSKPLSDRRSIEAHLKEELERARTAFDVATEQYGRVLRNPEDRNGTVGPDDDRSFEYALKAQHDTFEHYQRSLAAFNKFILYGELSH